MEVTASTERIGITKGLVRNIAVLTLGFRNNPLSKEQERNLRIWVDTLRSGQYQQTKQRLRTDKGHCCLGVMCDMEDTTRWMVEGSQHYWKVADKHMVNTLPPESLLARYGLTHQMADSLAQLNDSEDLDFHGISNVIESLLAFAPLPTR